MRLGTIAVATLLFMCVAANTANADNNQQKADGLLAEAATLGRAGNLKAAIKKFKAAELVYPRALHVCNIALAYARLKAWTQAQLFLGNCRERWGKDETRGLPEWVELRSREALDSLRAGNFVAMRFLSSPSGATVSVSTFAADETFVTPRVVWLPKGEHTVKFVYAGHVAVQKKRSFDSNGEWTVTLKPEPHISKAVLKPVAKPAVLTAPTEQPAARIPKKKRSMTVPLLATAAGIGLLAAGGVAHVFALKAKSDAEGELPGTSFNDFTDRFEARRALALGLYGSGVVVTAVATWLLSRTRKHNKEASVTVGATAARSGGMVWLSWDN